jgi:hypothetical protein
MRTRETHARIYQGEINRNTCKELESVAKEKGISLRELILEVIGKYLGDWNSRYSLDIEAVALNSGGARFYLWVPYENCDELDHLIKTRGTYIQELTRKAIKQRNQIDENK